MHIPKEWETEEHKKLKGFKDLAPVTPIQKQINNSI